MDSVEEKVRFTHPLTLWAVNPRLQTRFDLDDGGGEPPAEPSEPLTDQIDSEPEPETFGVSEPKDEPESTPAPAPEPEDPEAADRRAWQADYDATPARVRDVISRADERIQYLEQQLKQASRSPQPQPSQVTEQDYEQKYQEQASKLKLARYEAASEAAIAKAGGDENAWRQAAIRQATAEEKLDELRESRNRHYSDQQRQFERWWDETPHAVADQIKRNPELKPIHDLAPEFGDLHRKLVYAFGEQEAVATIRNIMSKFVAIGKKSKAPAITDHTRQIATNRSRSEPPDGGVAGGGGKSDPDAAFIKRFTATIAKSYGG